MSLGSDASIELDFKRLFESAPDMYLVLLPDAPTFTIAGASNAYLRGTHTQRDEIVGRGLFEVFPDNPDDPTASGTSNLRASLERALAAKSADAMAVQKYDIRRPDSEGGGFEERFWSPVNSPVLSKAGEVLYLLHRVEDVTEFVRVSRAGERQRERSEALERQRISMEQEILRRSADLDVANKSLRAANERLAELDRAKTAFFNNISHEFRTPLTLMLGPLEDCLAHSEKLSPEQRRRLELVHHNALRLLKLVNALLDFSRIEAGRMQATFVPTELGTLTAQLASAFHSATEKAGLRLSIECPACAEPAYVDRELWEKVVLNLVSNALKFTLEGEITVRLSERSDGFELVVADSGTGIPDHELPHLFERFHRVRNERARTHEGTGIGLSLVQELVKLHAGTIAVQSRIDVGTTFTVSIPKGRSHLPQGAIRDQGDGAARIEREAFQQEALRYVMPQGPMPAAGERAPPQAQSVARPRVLLVDDNADLRSYIQGLLSPRYEVQAVTDGVEALEAVRARAPELVLSDVMMPRLDGFGLLRALRADPSTRGVPVILLSARAGEESAVEGLDAGADDYLVKPFSARELLARVRTHLDLARDRRAWAADLERINRELEAFSYSVSHDLRAPLRAIDGFSKALLSDSAEALDDSSRHYLERIRVSTERMSRLIEDLFALSKIQRSAVHFERVDLTRVAEDVVRELRQREPERDVLVEIAGGLCAYGDKQLLTIALENLLGNAWKFTSKARDARIAFGREDTQEGSAFFVRDNGAGFDMAYAGKLFAPFQRLHRATEFEGTGIGLATVQRIVSRHGGRIRASAVPHGGATFHFTLGRDHAEAGT